MLATEPGHTPPLRWIRFFLTLYWTALAIATHWPRLELPFEDVVGFKLDKVIHFFAFVVLTLLILLAAPAGRHASQVAHLSVAAMVAVAYSFGDEWSQQWVHRTFDLADLMADHLGVWCTFLAVAMVHTRGGPASRTGIAARIALILLTPVLGATLLNPGVQLAYHQPLLGLAAAVLTCLVAAAELFGHRQRLLNIVGAILIVALLGPVVELAQSRWGTLNIHDVLAHELGTLLGGVLVFVMAWRSHGGDGRDAELPRNRRPSLSFVDHAVTVSVLTLLSRGLGLVRDAVIAAMFGMTAITDAFWFGFLVPNLFRRLFGEGALTSALVPVYGRLVQHDRVTARRLASLCVVLVVVGLGAATLLCELLLFVLCRSIEWSPSAHLALRLTMIMLPYMPMICLVAILGAMLQIHSRFGPPAAAPIILNLLLIGGTIYAAGNLYSASGLARAIHIVAFIVLVAGVAQVASQVIALARYEKPTVHFAGTSAALGSVTTALVPMIFTIAVFQINTLLDSLIAFGFSAPDDGAAKLPGGLAYPMQVGALTALQFAQRLYQFPLGVFGLALATAIFPALVQRAPPLPRQTTDPRADAGDFLGVLQQGLRLALFVGLPASAGLILVRLPLARMVFERGAFDLNAAGRVATILAGYASAVWAYTLTHILTRAFYALGDTRSPLRISVAMVILNLVLNLTLIWSLGAAGLAWSTAICAAAQVGLLTRKIQRHVQGLFNRSLLVSWMKTCTLTGAMVVLLLPYTLILDVPRLSLFASTGLLAALVATGIAIVSAGSWLWHMDEIRWLLKRQVRTSTDRPS